MLELDLWLNIAPFVLAMAIIIAVKYKLWVAVPHPSLLQKICGVVLTPLLVYNSFLLFIVLGYISDDSAAYGALFLIAYLSIITPMFGLLVILTKSQKLTIHIACAFAVHIVLFLILYLFVIEQDAAQAMFANGLSVWSIPAIISLLFAIVYWGYIRKWTRKAAPSI